MIRSLAILTLSLFSWAVFSGCNKECKPKSPASEASAMTNFATQNGMIDVQMHASGIMYEILDPGTDATANANSYIAITYTGRLLNGEVFDEQTTANTGSPWPLTSLIEGWRIGIPLIKEGGHIRLLIPSSLAYGCEGRGIIPGNAPLFFDVRLVDVQP